MVDHFILLFLFLAVSTSSLRILPLFGVVCYGIVPGSGFPLPTSRTWEFPFFFSRLIISVAVLNFVDVP